MLPSAPQAGIVAIKSANKCDDRYVVIKVSQKTVIFGGSFFFLVKYLLERVQHTALGVVQRLQPTV